MASWVGIVPVQLRPALECLLRANHYAEECRCDPWQFAVDLSQLLATGATLTDVRWLIQRGFALHGKETTIPGDAERTFRRLPVTSLPIDSCLVLSSQGASEIQAAIEGLGGAVAQISESEVPAHASVPAASPVGLPTTSSKKPEWDAERRELRYDGQVIKRYRVPAENQELILTAFQEEGWPHCIDDPLSPDGEVDPKQRLQATIKSLNRNQLVKLIRFHGNGNGLQVYWEKVPHIPTALLCKRR